ncbi:IS1634 family transposase, partial [Rhodococcus fascians]|nr:IS1634 family transposase [Rhodococcus fascians]
KRSRWLIEAIETGWRRLGLDAVDDDAFFQLVLGRLVEPTSMSDTSRVVAEIGLTPAYLNTYANALKRCATIDYRDQVAKKCVEHPAAFPG